MKNRFGESLKDIYRKGYNDGLYGYTYINPYWTNKEVNEWAKGVKGAKKGIKERINP